MEWPRFRLRFIGPSGRMVSPKFLDLCHFVGAEAEVDRMYPRPLQVIAAARFEWARTMCVRRTNGQARLAKSAIG